MRQSTPHLPPLGASNIDNYPPTNRQVAMRHPPQLPIGPPLPSTSIQTRICTDRCVILFGCRTLPLQYENALNDKWRSPWDALLSPKHQTRQKHQSPLTEQWVSVNHWGNATRNKIPWSTETTLEHHKGNPETRKPLRTNNSSFEFSENTIHTTRTYQYVFCHLSGNWWEEDWTKFTVCRHNSLKNIVI